MLRYLPYLMVIALWIYAFVDCLGTPEREVRGMPKVVWVLVILIFGEVLVGPVAWLLIGRRRGPAPAAKAAGAHPAADAAPEPRMVWVAPDDNPEFLRSLSELNQQNKENRNDGPPSPEGE